MQYRVCGKTNEKLSTLGFGCMRLPLIEGGNSAQIDMEQSINMVRSSIDQGVNYIDTAYFYHSANGEPGASEPFVAKALKDGYREKVNLATKLPIWNINTREEMDTYLNGQLNRLETEVIDFYLIHALDIKMWKKMVELGVAEFLDSAKKSGKIRYAGFSFHDVEESFITIIDGYDWDFCQIQYNYLDENTQAGKRGLLYAASKNIGVIIMEPLRGGNLAHSLPNEVKEAFESMDSSLTPAQWALRWVYNHEEVCTVLSGMNATEQIDQNMYIADKTTPNSMTEDEINTVNKVKDIFKSKIKINCTGCQYCMPCPAGVNIPRCFSIYNQYSMFGKKENYNYLKETEKANDCVACGKCVTMCPQGISIPKELEGLVAEFQK